MAGQHEGARARGAGPPARLAWAMFDWAGQPYYAIVAGVTFVPYFVSKVAPDPVTGQSWVGIAAGTAGLIIALISPVLGAIADAGGARKPWMAAFSALFIVALASLWWAEPGGSAPLLPIAAAMILAGIGIELTAVFNNAMLPEVARPGRIGELSGFGFGLGYVGGLVGLIIVLAAFSLPATGMVPWPPVFGLDSSAHEHDRITAPFAALWYLVFVLPLFLVVPDRPPSGLTALGAALRGLSSLRDTIAGLGDHANTLRFLIARMIYNDGLGLIWVFGAAYGTSLFDWSTAESGIFGLIIIIFSAAGAFIGGWLDDRIGPKRTVFLANAFLILGALAAGSVTSGFIFFIVPAADPLWQGPMGLPGEIVYLASGILIGIGAGPQQAASRTFMALLAPEDLRTEFFGLYSLSGRATNFIGPFLVTLLTALILDQRAAIFVILAHLVIGTGLLALVREPARAAQ